VEQYLGWAATAVFVGSYFFTEARALRRAQMIGALMWVMYGVLIAAPPVIACNLLVLGAAAVTMWRRDQIAGAQLVRRSLAKAEGPGAT
jgi:hypothetical protein